MTSETVKVPSPSLRLVQVSGRSRRRALRAAGVRSRSAMVSESLMGHRHGMPRDSSAMQNERAEPESVTGFRSDRF